MMFNAQELLNATLVCVNRSDIKTQLLTSAQNKTSYRKSMLLYSILMTLHKIFIILPFTSCPKKRDIKKGLWHEVKILIFLMIYLQR